MNMMDAEYRTLGKDATKTDGDDIQDNKVVLSRFLGLIPAISFTLGLIIGTGIFLTPTGVLRGSSGSIGVSLIVWAVGAFISSTGAMCMTELTIYFRQSGGSFVFLSSVYGPKVGFLSVWVTFFVIFPCSSAIQSMVIVNFLLTPFIGVCDSVSETAIKLGATCVVLLAVFINAMSSRHTARAQVFMCFVKTGALIAIILMGAVKMIQNPSSANIQKPFQPTGEFEVSKLPSAFFSAYFAYGGWENISNITEEIKKPAKTVVRAMTISFVLVTILYLLANIAYLTVLTPEEIMSSNAVAALFAVRVLGTRWSFIIWLCVVLSAAGILNGGTYSKSRIYFVAARAGQFPFILSTIHVRRKTPLAAIITVVPITLLVIWSGNIWSIIDFVVCFAQILSMLTIGIVPYLRWKQPDRVLSYKAPLWSSVVYIVFTTALVLMSVYTNPIQVGISAAIICVAFIWNGLVQLLNRSDRTQAKIILAVFINAMSSRHTARAQVFMCFVKTGALIAIILMGAVKMIQNPSSANIQKPFQPTGEFEVSKLPSAFFSAYFAYGGWENISNITEEIKKPAKTVVRAMTISFILVTILYLLANIAYLTVLTPEEIMSSNAVAALFAVRVLGSRWSFIIWLCVVLSAAGILNGGTYSKSRIYFVAARAGQFPFILSTIHVRRKTPLAAIITVVPITLLVIWSGNIWSIIDFVVCFAQILSMLTIGIVPYLRWKQPDRVLSYKAPLWSSVVYIVFTTALVLMSVYTNPMQVGISAAIICVAFIWYGLVQLLNRSDRAQAKIKYFNDFLQKLLLSVQQEVKTY